MTTISGVAVCLPRRFKPRRWTDAQRKIQAHRMRKARVWRYATGPRTPAGKARASQNARKHGRYDARRKAIRAALGTARRFNHEMRGMLWWTKKTQTPFSGARKKPGKSGLRPFKRAEN